MDYLRRKELDLQFQEVTIVAGRSTEQATVSLNRADETAALTVARRLPQGAAEIRIRYKSDKVKAYFKEQRALRVETTINNARDFGLGRRLCAENWRTLRQTGLDINTRFLAALAEGGGCSAITARMADVSITISTTAII